jgi:hypothetical protein
MESLNLSQLIERLQHLHLEQERILTALENIVADNEPVHEPAPAAVPVPPVPPTVTVVAHEPAPAAVSVPPVPPAATVVATIESVAVFHIGQRVYITNRINHVLVRRATEADRTAIVTHFTPSHVAIRTINGYHTHRHPKNLRPLL